MHPTHVYLTVRSTTKWGAPSWLCWSGQRPRFQTRLSLQEDDQPKSSPLRPNLRESINLHLQGISASPHIIEPLTLPESQPGENTSMTEHTHFVFRSGIAQHAPQAQTNGKRTHPPINIFFSTEFFAGNFVPRTNAKGHPAGIMICLARQPLWTLPPAAPHPAGTPAASTHRSRRAVSARVQCPACAGSGLFGPP